MFKYLVTNSEFEFDDEVRVVGIRMLAFLQSSPIVYTRRASNR